MTTTRTPRATAHRPGLTENWRAVWQVTFYEAAEDGIGRKPKGRCCTMEVEAHPLTSNRTIGHQVWLYINRERPDIPDVDMHSAHVQLQGFAAGKPDENGRLPRLHGVRCTKCGSDQVTLTVRAGANCRFCGHSQMQSEAMLCSDHCEACNAAGATDE